MRWGNILSKVNQIYRTQKSATYSTHAHTITLMHAVVPILINACVLMYMDMIVGYACTHQLH